MIALALATPSPAMATVSEQILDRAASIRKLGEWIGTFEFLVFSELKRYQVYLYVGAGRTNVREVFAPGLGPLPEPLGECHVIGCKLTGDGFGLGLPEMIGGSPSFNHWAIGVPMTGTLSGVSHVKDVHLFKVVMASMGLAVVETQALGDCGVDVLTHALALTRCAATYRKLRSELADFMAHCAGSPAWHDAWLACCEFAPAIVAPSIAPSTSPSVPLDEASAESPSACEASAESQSASAAPLAPADVPLASAALVSAPAPSTPPPLPPPLETATSETSLAASPQQDHNAGQQKGQLVASFREHLLSLDKDALALITGSFGEFKAAEDWKHVCILVDNLRCIRTYARTHVRACTYVRTHLRSCAHARAFFHCHEHV